MLAILALHKGEPFDRGRLAGMLWPESPEAAAQHSFRQALAGLRRLLGPAKGCVTSVSTNAVQLHLSQSVWVDVLEFDNALKDGNTTALERGISLYREQLLAGCDEPFFESDRAMRSLSFLAATDQLSDRYSSDGNHRGAATILRRSIAEDPYRVRSCRALMRSLAELGEAPAALEFCRDFRVRLRRDLNTDIDQDTKALYKSIRLGLGTAKPAARKEVRSAPTYFTEIIGRQSEIEEVASLVHRCRLVTLIGAGGVGKTRLSIAVADQVADQFMDGVRCVDLTPLQSDGNVVMAIANALEIKEDTGRPILETIVNRIQGREGLLVLDNCEHVAFQVARTLDKLLTSCRGLHVLATSRQSLGVGGEQVWRVPSLSLEESVKLFLERSHTHSRRDEREMATIGSICQRLDGVPLAIELAAARTAILSPKEIANRLSDQFALLTGGNRTLPRQQTLQASIDWSWSLLSDIERRALMTLSVFRGGCSLEAAEATIRSEVPVLDLLSSLVDRSLVTSRTLDSESRFYLLETIRQFNERKLSEAGEDTRARDAHRDFFLALAEAGSEKMHTDDQLATFGVFEREHDNFRAAISWCHSTKEYETALSFVKALGRFWDTCGYLSEGRAQVETALAHDTPNTPRISRAGAHIHAGWIAFVQGDYEDAVEHFELALPVFREEDSKIGIAKAVMCLGCANCSLRNFEAAQAQFEEAYEIFMSMDMEGGAATNLTNLGEMALHQKQSERARAYLEQSLALRRSFSYYNPEATGELYRAFSIVDFRQGRLPEARSYVLKAIKCFDDAALVVQLPNSLEQLAIVQGGFGNWESAAQFFGAADGLSTSKGTPPLYVIADDHAATIGAAKAALGAGKFQSLYDAGRAMSLADAVQLALEQDSAVMAELL